MNLQTILKRPRLIGFIICVIALFAYYIPYIVLGQDSIITIHDNLDAYLPNLVTQANYSQWLSTGEYPVMDGSFSYWSLQDWISVKMLLFIFMNPFAAYLINDMIVRVVAIIFMFLLLYDYVLKSSNYRLLISILSSVAFAFVAFYTIYGLTSSGVPLIAWCVLNIRNGVKKIESFILMALLPLFSTLALTGFYVGCVLGVYLLISFIRKERNVWPLFWASALMVGMYVVVNIPTLLSFFDSSVTHRAEFRFIESWYEILFGRAQKLFLYGQFHYGSYKSIYCIIAIIVALICNKGVDKPILYMFIGVLAIVSFATVFYVVKNCFPGFKFVQSLQLDRFYMFLLPLWILLLARSLSLICSRKYMKYLGFALAIVTSCVFIYTNKEFKSNVKLMLGLSVEEVPYNHFYDVDLFSMIKKDMDCNNPYEHKVVSVGMYPGIALYNQFYTLDAYLSSYPLQYKHKFKEVILPELEKDKNLCKYYDNWGSRCYLFSADCGKRYMYGKNDKKQITLDINVEKLRELGCEYIFSAVDISNYGELGIVYINEYTTADSYWKIRVYKL